MSNDSAVRSRPGLCLRRWLSRLAVVQVSAALIACSDITPPDASVAPVVLVQPNDQALMAGQQAVLAVTATGVGVAFQWQQSADESTWTDIAGETRATLTLGAVRVEDQATRYRVKVFNDGGRASSRAVHMVVRPAPIVATFVQEPVGASALVGQQARFTVRVLGATASQVSWQSSTDREQWIPVAGASGLTLTTGALTTGDNPTYFRAAIATSQGPVYSDVAALSVATAAVAPDASNTGTAWRHSRGVGGAIVVATRSTAVPTPTVTWQVSADNGTTYVDVLPEPDLRDAAAAAARVLGITYSEISVPRASLARNDLKFRAVVSNSAGSYTTPGATIPASAGSPILDQPGDQAWRADAVEASFEVHTVGDGLTYQWQASRDGGASYTDINGARDARYVHRGDETVDHVRVLVTSGGVPTNSEAAALLTSRWDDVHPLPTGEDLVGVAWVDAQTAIALSLPGRVLRTDDAGATWRVVSYASDDSWASGLAVNTRPGGTGTALSVDWSGRLRRSADGLHWKTIDHAFDPTPLSGVSSLRAVTFGNGSTAVAVGSTIVRSLDDGLTWQLAAIGGLQVSALAGVAFNDAEVGLAVGDKGVILRSLDLGAHWAPVAVGMTSADLRTVTFLSNQVALAAGVNGTLLRSEDGGASWARVTSLVEPNTYFISLSARNATRAALASTSYLYLTSDAGRSWTRSVRGQDSATAYSPQGALLAVGYGGSIRLSPNGTDAWITASAGSSDRLTSVAFATPSVGVAVSDGGGILRTADGGQTWSAVNSGTSDGLLAVTFADAQTGVALDFFGGALRTRDGGQTWSPVADLDRASLYDIAFSNATNGVAAGLDGLYRTSDGGATWTQVGSNDLMFAVRFGSASVGIALGGNGSALRTVDGGATWAALAMPPVSYLNGLAYVDENTVLVHGVESGGFVVYRSTDGGANWAKVPMSFDLAKVAFANPGLGLAVSGGGSLYRSADGGQSWSIEPWGGRFNASGITFADSHTAIAVELNSHQVRRRASY